MGGMGACAGGSCGPMGCGGPLTYSGIPVGNWPGGGAFTCQADPCAPAAPTSVASAPAPSQPQGPIQTTTYRPYSQPYAPTAAPASPGYYRPQPAAVPSYWYGN